MFSILTCSLCGKNLIPNPFVESRDCWYCPNCGFAIQFEITTTSNTKSLEDLLSKVTEEIKHELVDWGKPVGKEVW